MTWLLLCAALTLGASTDVESHRQEIDEWHQGRMDKLHSPEDWLSLVGLHRIHDGENSIGSADGSAIQLVDKAPASVGVIAVDDGKATLTPADGVDLSVNGEPVSSPVRLYTDIEDTTTVCELGSLRFYAIERSGKLLLRVKDHEAPLISKVTHIERYDVDMKWRIRAQWTPYEPAKKIRVVDVFGNLSEEELEGYLAFEVDGEPYTMEPIVEGDHFFLIFSDETSGDETYGAGRYIYLPFPDEEGTVWLDFNRAENMPCVFTEFSTCPLPPEGNDYPFRVTAGEKMWGDQH